MFLRSLITLTLLVAVAPMLAAQTGGQFDLSHNVVAGGGGQSTGGTISVEGTVGQAVAGVESSNGNYNIRGGFWAFHQFAPTAAGVSLGGRILAAEGNGIRNVSVTLTNLSTGEIRTALSSSIGYYRFDDVPSAQFYSVTVRSKRFSFDPDTRVINVVDELTDVDFTALPLIDLSP
jgi:hypothetical protein